MRITLIFAIIVSALAVVVALQNAQPVNVSFLKWSFEASLVIVLLLTFFAGVVAAFVASIPWRVKVMRELSSYRKTGRPEQP